MAAKPSELHQSSTATTSTSLVGWATTSGGLSSCPSMLRTTSRKALPWVWAARSALSVRQISCRAAGGITRDCRNEMWSSSGGGRVSISSVPNQVLTMSARARSWSAEGAWSSHPQPHHDLVRSVTSAHRSFRASASGPVPQGLGTSAPQCFSASVLQRRVPLGQQRQDQTSRCQPPTGRPHLVGDPGDDHGAVGIHSRDRGSGNRLNRYPHELRPRVARLFI